jgi:ribosomal protein S27AE
LFFLIGGVQPKTVRLDKQGRTCPRCGYAELYAKRVDQYFSLFFVPLFRVKKGVPFVSCDHCRSVLDQNGRAIDEPRTFRKDFRKCPTCGRSLDEDFEFCPRCGQKIRRL